MFTTLLDRTGTACVAVTSLTRSSQRCPARRHHARPLVTGDRLNWIRDLTYHEDRSKPRTANGPRVAASLRNLAITIMRPTGQITIAAAVNHHARRPRQATSNDHELPASDLAGTLTAGRRPNLLDMQVIARLQDRGAQRLDHLHDQALCGPKGVGDRRSPT